jgi:hypothetical protein
MICKIWKKRSWKVKRYGKYGRKVRWNFHIFSPFSSLFSISFHYLTWVSSIFAIWFHNSTYFSSAFSIYYHYSIYFSSVFSKNLFTIQLAIQKKIKLNSEKTGKIWKKSKLNSEKIWKIQKKIVRFTIQPNFLPHFPYLITIQFTFLLYFQKICSLFNLGFFKIQKKIVRRYGN